eukprot:3502944-Alexandrium_andersonii.AAC.1
MSDIRSPLPLRANDTPSESRSAARCLPAARWLLYTPRSRAGLQPSAPPRGRTGCRGWTGCRGLD